MSTEEVIVAVCHLVQSIALLICAVMSYFTGKKLLAVWRQMSIALWELRGLINKSKVTDLSENAIKGQSSASGNSDEKASGKAGSI